MAVATVAGGLTVAAIRLETTFLLVDSDLHYDERDQVLVAMSQELTVRRTILAGIWAAFSNDPSGHLAGRRRS